MGRDDRALLDEQIGYYRALATGYAANALDLPGADEIVARVDAFAPSGDVLELACGPGTWTPRLLRTAATLTAVDAAPEMLALARARVAADAHRVRFVRADLFSWSPDRRYDAVFFGFWISHVPRDRFDRFWELVDRCLAPGGRVLFVDDAHRTDDELIEGPASSVIRRRLPDGATHRAVKVPHTVDGLNRELARLGWDVTVRPTAGPFFWGEGVRTAGRAPSPGSR